MIVLITKDLFFVPVIRSACQNQGTQLLVATRVGGAKLDEAQPEQIAACVIDLSSVPAAEVPDCVSELRGRFPAARVIAFGPHVQTGRLDAAAEAGCDQILTRGQLSSQIEKLVSGWIGSSGGIGPDVDN